MIQPAKTKILFKNTNYGLMSSKHMAQIIACNVTFAFNNILQIHAEYQLIQDCMASWFRSDDTECSPLDTEGLCYYSTSQQTVITLAFEKH